MGNVGEEQAATSAVALKDSQRRGSGRIWTLFSLFVFGWLALSAVVAGHLVSAEWVSRYRPVVVALSAVVIGATAWVAYLAARHLARPTLPAIPRPRGEGSGRNPVEFADVATLLERESRARVIWVVSPRLFYDVYDPEFRRVVRANKERGAEYRYIVPNSAEVRRNLLTYGEIYGEAEDRQQEIFLVLPESRFVAFLTEVAIYDPGQDSMYAFAAPPATQTGREGVMILEREVSTQYARKFRDIWLAGKNRAP